MAAPVITLVIDTNTIVSGILWQGPPGKILDLHRSGTIKLLSSEPLLDELRDVLSRPKFSERFQRIGKTPAEVIDDYRHSVLMINPPLLPPVILADLTDDKVLACAVDGRADYIVSGDHHVLELGSYAGIPVLSAMQLLERINPRDPDAAGNDSD